MTHKSRVLELLSDGEPHSHHELYAASGNSSDDELSLFQAPAQRERFAA